MRLYLSCVEARLRGILHCGFVARRVIFTQSHVMNKTGIKSWLTIATSHKYFNKSYIVQSTHIVRLWTKPKEKKITQLLDPRSSQLGSTTDQHETIHSNDQDLHRAPPELGCVICTDSTAPASWFLEVSVSHGDSTISHPRDQDYLSLWVR